MHNIAVYHEMKDDIPEAEKWALKAQELARKVEKIDDEKKGKQDLSRIPNYVMISLYLVDLQKRMNGLSTLNMQMSRFNDDF